MADIVTRGNTITKDAYYKDAGGQVVEPTDPRVTIITPAGVSVVVLDVPTQDSVGHYVYAYGVPADAPLGGYTIRWQGIIGGQPVTDDDVFTVVAAGSVSAGVAGGETCSPWATSSDAGPPCNAYDFDVAVLDENMQVASDILYNLTGRRWSGECLDEIRPQAQWRASDTPRFWPRSSSSPFGYCSCSRPRETGCSHVPEIKLPGYPAYDVVVRLDGVQYFADDGLFELVDDRYVARIDGQGWPCCQRNDLPLTEEGTFGITYGFGSGPPIGGVRSAAMYGCQLALAWDPEAIKDGRCRLPKRVTAITRAGTSAAVFDPMTFIKDGLTGLPDVDAWVGSIRQGDSRRRATVLVPGRHRSARRPD